MNPRMTSVLAPIATLLVLGGTLLASSPASARTEILRWTEPSGQDVVRFELLIGPSPSNHAETRDLGLPATDGQGIYTSSFVVPDEDDVYIAVRAVGSTGLLSPASNEQLRSGMVVSTPPPGSTASGPSDPAALAWVDFSQGGANDWLDTRAGNSLVQDDALFTVASLGGHSALMTQSAGDYIHSHFDGTPSSFSNMVLSGRMAIDRADAGIGVTAYSQYPNADVYYRLAQRPNETFRIASHPSASVSCSNADTGVTPQPGRWYVFELVVADEGAQNRISASVWEQGTSKPGSPQAQCVDASSGRPSAGRFGVWSMGTGQKYWDEFEVIGLGGGAGPAPLDPPVLLD